MKSRFHIRSALLLGISFSSVMLAGCSSSSTPPTPAAPPPPVNPGSAGWGYEIFRAGKRAGIDYACLRYWTWDDTVALAVWVDHTARTRINSKASGGQYEFKASFLTQAEEPLAEIGGHIASAQTGRLTIDGQELDLSDGWLVLVATAEKKVRVKQLKRPVLKDPKGSSGLFEKMASEPEIAAFFAQKTK